MLIHKLKTENIAAASEPAGQTDEQVSDNDQSLIQQDSEEEHGPAEESKSGLSVSNAEEQLNLVGASFGTEATNVATYVSTRNMLPHVVARFLTERVSGNTVLLEQIRQVLDVLSEEEEYWTRSTELRQSMVVELAEELGLPEEWWNPDPPLKFHLMIADVWLLCSIMRHGDRPKISMRANCQILYYLLHHEAIPTESLSEWKP